MQPRTVALTGGIKDDGPTGSRGWQLRLVAERSSWSHPGIGDANDDAGGRSDIRSMGSRPRRASAGPSR